MKPDIAARFEAAADRYDSAINARQRARDQERSSREKFENDWVIRRNGVVVPAFEEIAQTLRRHRWECQAEGGDAANPLSATVKIWKGNMRAAGAMEVPNIRFQPDSGSEKISIHGNSLATAGPRGTFDLNLITSDFVQEKVAEFFQTLVDESQRGYS